MNDKKETSDGTTASYYELPKGATEIYQLCNHKNMSGNIAEAFRSLYRLGESSHSDQLRDLRKVATYLDFEQERLEAERKSVQMRINQIGRIREKIADELEKLLRGAT